MWAFYIPTMLAVLVATAAVQRKYASPAVPLPARAIVGVAWVTSASIVALVPIDVWAALTGAGRRTTDAVGTLWAAAYWTTQALTWGVIPIAAGMADAGDFTAWGRFKTSLRDSAFYYGALTAAALAGLALLLASGRLAWRGLPGLVMVLVNAYGLVAVVLLLGHGLVAIPRSLWRASFPARRLRTHYWRVAHAADELKAAATEAQAVATVVEATVQPLPRRDPLRPLADDVRAHAEASASPFKPSAAPRDVAGRVRLDNLTDADLDYACDGAAGLAALKRRVTRAAGAYAGARAAYSLAVADALGAEAQASGGGGGGGGGGGHTSTTAGRLSMLDGEPGPSTTPLAGLAAAWAVARPWALRASAAAAATLGFLIIWSEATLATGTHPDLSPFSHAIHAAIGGGAGAGANGTATSGGSSELAAQALVGAPLAYAAAAAYRSLFALGVFPFYRVVPGATGPRSLLANAGAVTRFAAPLAYNYLHVIRMVDDAGGKGGAPPTVFARKMAPAMRDVPLLGASFNTWFPAVVALYALALCLDVAGSVARAVLPARYAGFADSGDGEGGSGEGGGGEAGAAVERGRALVREEASAAGRGEALGSALAATIVGGLPPVAGGGGGGGQAAAASPARSETELGRGGAVAGSGWHSRLPGGLPAAPAPPPPPVSAGTARRLAGVSPLTRALLGQKYTGSAGGSLLDGGPAPLAAALPVPALAGAVASAAAAPAGLDALFGKFEERRVDDEGW